MPICTIGRGACGERASSLDQWAASSGMPKGYRTSVKVDLVGNIVPLVGCKLDLPLRYTAHIPLKFVASLATILELREVTLEESDLVFVGRGRSIGRRGLDREVVVNGAFIDRSTCLRNKLCSQHGLPIPLCGLIDSDLGTLLGARIRWILEGSVEIDISVDTTGAMNVVLVRADWIAERPF